MTTAEDQAPDKAGTVEILRDRIYPLDPEAQKPGSTVYVTPGAYPLYRHMNAYFWMMTGQINRRGREKIGDGLFVLNPGDRQSGVDVTFPSASFGPQQLCELLAARECLPGPHQRLRFMFRPGQHPSGEAAK